MEHDLSSVVPVVGIPLFQAGKALLEITGSGGQRRIQAARSQVLPHQQSFGRHRQRIFSAGVIREATLRRSAFHRVQPFRDAGVRRFRNVQPGHLTTLQSHQLPAGHRRVGFKLWTIPPAAELRMLRSNDEVERFLSRIFQPRILRHAVRFAQRDRRHAVAVQPDKLRTVCKQVAGFFLALNKPLQTSRDFVLILPRTMRMSGSKKRQQCQARRCRVRLKTSMPQAIMVFAVELVNAPVAGCKLVTGQPLQTSLNRLFRRIVAAEFSHSFSSDVGTTHGKSGADRSALHSSRPRCAAFNQPGDFGSGRQRRAVRSRCWSSTETATATACNRQRRLSSADAGRTTRSR